MPVPTIEERMREHLAAHPNATASDLARALGLARQRILAAAKEYGITLAKSARPAALTLYACPACGLEAWTKAGAILICGARHGASGEGVRMETAAVQRRRQD